MTRAGPAALPRARPCGIVASIFSDRRLWLFSFSEEIDHIQENTDEPHGRVSCDVRVQWAFDRNLMGGVALDRLSVKAPCRVTEHRHDESQAKKHGQRA
jgi:hypothetical protein